MSKPKIEVSLHPSNWLRVAQAEFLGSDYTAFADGCVRAGAQKRSERNNRFFLLLPEKMDVLRGELEQNFELVIDGDAEAVWRKEQQDRQKDYEEVEEAIRVNNERFSLLAEPSSVHTYQRLASHWLASRRSGLLALPTGVGKTLICLQSVPRGSLVLVTCPSGVAIKWCNEIRDCREGIDGDNLRVTLHTSKGSLKLNPQRDHNLTEFHVMSYGNMPEMSVLQSTLFYTKMPSRVIYFIDEAHYAANMRTAIRAKKCKQMCVVVLGKGGRVYPITSTPMDGNPEALWNVLSLGNLETEAFVSPTNFRRLFNVTQGPHGPEWGKPDATVPILLEKVALIKRKEEILPQLPPKMPDIIIPVEVQVKAHKKFDALWMEILAEMDKGLALGDVLKRCRQGRLGISFTELAETAKLLATQKIPAMKEIVLEYLVNQEPLVVASNHLEPLYALRDMEEGEGPWGPYFPIVTGEQDIHERQRMIESFQNGLAPVIGISIRCAREGIDLWRASHMLYTDTHWSRAANDQVADRIHRLGTTKPCWYKFLLANHPLDLRIHEVNMCKSEITEAALFGVPGKPKLKITKDMVYRIIEKLQRGIATDAERTILTAVLRRLHELGSLPSRQ